MSLKNEEHGYKQFDHGAITSQVWTQSTFCRYYFETSFFYSHWKWKAPAKEEESYKQLKIGWGFGSEPPLANRNDTQVDHRWVSCPFPGGSLPMELIAGRSLARAVRTPTRAANSFATICEFRSWDMRRVELAKGNGSVGGLRKCLDWPDANLTTTNDLRFSKEHA
jgi:hypothetical protein